MNLVLCFRTEFIFAILYNISVLLLYTKTPRAASHGMLLDDRKASAESSCDKRATYISDTRAGSSSSDDIETSKSLDVYSDRAAK